jgi:hypothetical protein
VSLNDEAESEEEEEGEATWDQVYPPPSCACSPRTLKERGWDRDLGVAGARPRLGVGRGSSRLRRTRLC